MQRPDTLKNVFLWCQNNDQQKQANSDQQIKKTPLLAPIKKYFFPGYAIREMVSDMSP